MISSVFLWYLCLLAKWCPQSVTHQRPAERTDRYVLSYVRQKPVRHELCVFSVQHLSHIFSCVMSRDVPSQTNQSGHTGKPLHPLSQCQVTLFFFKMY